MNTKKILRKIIYGILFAIMIFCFIFLSEKYADNGKTKILTINDYYDNVISEKFTPIRGYQLVNNIKSEKSIIFIGSSKKEASKKYVLELENIIEEIEAIDKIYYYDIQSDKYQGNSSYYKILDLLEGSLVSTDEGANNLLAPSLYIIDKGNVLYYNIETVAMKNTDTTDDYWTEDKELSFKEEIVTAINKYYLN